MAYKQDLNGMFGEYQSKEYPNPKGMSTQEIARMAQNNAGRLPAGLQGYESHTPGYGDIEVNANESASIAKRSMFSKPAGLQGVEDDAFLGYGDGSILSKSVIEEDDEEDDDEDELDGLGNANQNLESWHSNFHKASLAKTDTALIKSLAEAVLTVPNDTPVEVRKQYYELAKAMLIRRKKTDLRHLDVQRAEIESNIGWLIDPRLPKTGGFNKMLEQAVGALGPKLAAGDKSVIKAEHRMALGRKLKDSLRKAGQLAGFGEENPHRKLVLVAGLGFAAVALYCYMQNKKGVAASKKNKKKK